MAPKKELAPAECEKLLNILKERFKKNTARHESLAWAPIQAKLAIQPEKLWSLNEMEKTGGEPDVVAYHQKTDEYLFYDCAAESPAGRRSLCYDHEAWEARKENRPKNNVVDVAAQMGIELLSEKEYRSLQQLGIFDTKTSSWLKTPAKIRQLNGALFADFRYGQVFVYHNGAQSYYAARGFRGSLKV